MLKSLIIPLGEKKRVGPRDLVVRAHPARPPHSLPILVNLLGHHMRLVTSTHTHSSLPQPGTFSHHPCHPPYSLQFLTSLLGHHIRLVTSTHTHSSLNQVRLLIIHPIPLTPSPFWSICWDTTSGWSPLLTPTHLSLNQVDHPILLTPSQFWSICWDTT
jgi:hypothetical protein